ncbi:MAG: ATP-binding cassette domain-containing protein, partial [Thermodesulfobacteriota bacterium]
RIVMLEVSNLLVFYENALALNDFSMKVDAGSIVAVIGSNSAGKTTLMNTISGLIIDTQIKEQRKGGERITIYGKIFFEGEDITYLYPSERAKKGVALCRERHPIFPESDLLENLRIAGYLRSKAEITETIDYFFHLFPSMARLKSRKAGFLSGGEQQMLAIGMALMVKPKLLLLDEPLLGLSPIMQTTLLDAVRLIIRETGLTLVMTEQFARPILPIIDRGYIIENGMLTMEGAGLELMDNPEVKAAYFGV